MYHTVINTVTPLASMQTWYAVNTYTGSDDNWSSFDTAHLMKKKMQIWEILLSPSINMSVEVHIFNFVFIGKLNAMERARV